MTESGDQDGGQQVKISSVDIDEAARRQCEQIVAAADGGCSEVEGYQRAPSTAAALPPSILSALLEFREDPAANALVLRGLPLGSTAGTVSPTDPIGAPRCVAGFQQLFLGVLSVLGTVFAYSTQQGGRLVNNIAPSSSSRTLENVGTGSGQPFGFHTEDAFMDNPPSYLQLACVRNPTRTGTFLAGFPEDLDDEIRRALREPEFVVGVNPGQAGWTAERAGPVLYGSPTTPCLRLNLGRTVVREGAPNRYHDALEQLTNALPAGAVEVLTEPGDILIVNNYRTCHARSAFPASYDGTDRWLQRVVAYRDPRAVADRAVMRGYPVLEAK